MVNKIINNAITAVLALGLSTAGAETLAKNEPQPSSNSGQDAMQSVAIPGMERCFGIVKAGANDCGNALHNCSGEAKIDKSKSEWVYVPTGLCKRIAGGNLQSSSES